MGWTCRKSIRRTSPRARSRSVAGGTWGCGYAWVPVTGRVALRPNRSLRAERAVSLACAALANRQIGFGRVRFALRPFPHRCVGFGGELRRTWHRRVRAVRRRPRLPPRSASGLRRPPHPPRRRKPGVRRRNAHARRRPGRARGTDGRDQSPWKCGRFPETKGEAEAKAHGRRSGRGRRQSCDCRTPVTQGATCACARASTAGNRTRLSATHTISFRTPPRSIARTSRTPPLLPTVGPTQRPP